MPERVEKFTKDDRILKLMLSLAIPAMISGLVDNLYNTVDSIFVGQFVGSEGLAALSVINVIQTMYISMGVLFGVGNSSIVSRALGARDMDKARLSLVHAFWTLFILSNVIGFTVLINLDWFLGIIGASSRTLPYAKSYGSIILWGGFLLPINGMMLGAFRAKGEALKSTYLTVLGAVINTILDAVFIMYFGWGVAGAALATICSQGIVFVVAVIHLKKLYDTNFLFKEKSEIAPSMSGEIVKVGFPAGAKLILLTLTFSVANNVLVKYGDDYISAFGVFNRFVMIFSTINIALGMGVQPIIGMNYGARLYMRVKRVMTLAVRLSLVISALSSIFLWFAPEVVYRLFTSDIDIIRACREISRPQAYTYAGWGLFFCITEASLAMGHAREALLSSIAYPLSIMFGFIVFDHFWGLRGALCAFPFSFLVVGIISLILLVIEFRRLDRRAAVSC